jgi:hypothetical protein
VTWLVEIKWNLNLHLTNIHEISKSFITNIYRQISYFYYNEYVNQFEKLMKEVIMSKHTDPPKKPWNTPQLVIHGDVAKITEENPIPPKKFGSSDGVIASAQNVHHWKS